MYRREALEHVGGHAPKLKPFDEGLVSYYEDVDLACRLRAGGWNALCVSSGARAARRIGER